MAYPKDNGKAKHNSRKINILWVVSRWGVENNVVAAYQRCGRMQKTTARYKKGCRRRRVGSQVDMELCQQRELCAASGQMGGAKCERV